MHLFSSDRECQTVFPKGWYQFTLPPAFESSSVSSPTLDIVSCLGYSGRCLLIAPWDFHVHLYLWGLKLSSFSLVYWSTHWMSCIVKILSNSFPIFHCIAFLLLDFGRHCNLYTRHIFCGLYMLQILFSLRFICSLSKCVFCWTEVPILINSEVPMFSLLLGLFVSCLQCLCLPRGHKNVLIRYFLEAFTSGLDFCLWHKWGATKLILPTPAPKVVQVHLFFSKLFFPPPSRKSVTQVVVNSVTSLVWVLWWTLLFFPLYVHVLEVHCVNHYSVIVHLASWLWKSWKVLFQMDLSVLGSVLPICNLEAACQFPVSKKVLVLHWIHRSFSRDFYLQFTCGQLSANT